MECSNSKGNGYTVKRLQVNTASGTNSLEVVWTLVTPPSPIRGCKHFICVALYSPPKSKINDKLIDHIEFNLNRLLSVYPGAGIFLGGDVNNLSIEKLRNCYPDMVNLVTNPTYRTKILDVVVSNLHCEYDKAKILPPIEPDTKNYGKPSDHSVAVVRPNVDRGARTGFSRTETRTRRVMTATNVMRMALFLACFSWTSLYSLKGVDSKLDYVESVLFAAQDSFCPLQSYTVKLNGSYRVSAKLAHLSKLKTKEFRKKQI